MEYADGGGDVSDAQGVTYDGGVVTVTDTASAEKRRALRAQGALHDRAAAVAAEPFRTHPEFFDSDDRLPVGWVMVRARAEGEMTVSEAGRSFGVSRQTFSGLRLAFQARDIAGLTQGERGAQGVLKASVDGRVRAPGQGRGPLGVRRRPGTPGRAALSGSVESSYRHRLPASKTGGPTDGAAGA